MKIMNDSNAIFRQRMMATNDRIGILKPLFPHRSTNLAIVYKAKQL